MKLLAASITDFIVSQLSKASKDAREIRIILPSLPCGVALNVGKSLQEHCLQLEQTETKVSLIYKIAYQLGRDWQDSADSDVIDQYKEITMNGWYDEKNQLTYYRDLKRNPKTEDFLLTVLVGWDRVTDQASLADFFRLDYKNLWTMHLQSTFSSWLRKRLGQDSIEYEESHLQIMDQLLTELVETSLADLPQISYFLGKIDFTDAQDGRDAFLIMVQNLGFFKLPCLRGFASGKKMKRFLPYMTAAIEFFNYSTYLDSYKIKKDLKIIEDFKDNFTEEVDSDDLGDYESKDNLLKGLRKYIEGNDAYERDRLKKVNFVFIQDRILGFKKSGTKTPPQKVKKISGMPLSAVLRAVWLTLGDFKAKALEQKQLAIEEIKAIEITGELFRHDCEGDEDTSNDHEMLNTGARQFLKRMIGGIDHYIENHISFSPDPRNEPDRVVHVSSVLCPPMESPSELAFEKTTRAEPYLRFRVLIKGASYEVRRRFIWRIPQTHAYRTVVAMFKWLYEEGLTDGNPLPVFSIPYFEEIIQSKDDDEVNRVLQLALQNSSKVIHNLLISNGIDHDDTLLPHIQKLSYEYATFSKHVYENGIFYAMDKFNALHRAYSKTYKKYLRDSTCKESQLGPLLFRAYFLTGEHSADIGSNWMWRDYEPCCVISPLHPSVLEMMYHQHAFLCESFGVSARQALQGTGSRQFNEKIWNDVEDLAKIQWPISGILQEGPILDTNIRSFELIHLVGENTFEDATLTTRLMLRYDATEDEDITDEDLFRETRESRLIYRILSDYLSLHPHARDGIAIAAFCSGNVQPIIAGIDAYLSELIKDREDRIYTLSLTLFAESQDDSTISRWVNEWGERWQEAQSSNKYSYYGNCRISVAHRLIAREKNYSQFRGLLVSMDLDVAFMMHFVRAGSGGNKFEPIAPYNYSETFRMFPVLEKSCSSIAGGGKETVRDRMISNRQFALGSLHADVMAKLTGRSDGEYVVLGRGDFSPWADVIDELHKRSAWVICIDPSVDERLISKENEYGVRQREIIGFGSGVGAHGEYNYTVSTECFSMADIKTKISSHIAAKLGPWEQEISQKIAETILKESLHMAGLSLVRATGPSQYIRDYLAYAIIRKLLKRDAAVFCDELISLDAYRHWFDTAHSGERPDLIRIKANIENGCFTIEMQLIECKLANESERHLQKAREQLENGLDHLVSCFRPRSKTKLVGLDDRPDQRYWWLQLHRLIASKGQVKYADYNACISALERLSDGFYTIKWKAAAVTFWTDSQDSEIEAKNRWDFSYENNLLPISVIQTGRNFIKALCADGIESILPLGQEELIFSSIPDSVRDDDNNEPENRKDQNVTDRDSLNDEQKEPTNQEGTVETEKSIRNTEHISVNSKRMPDRIFLGSGTQSGRKVYWEFGHKDLANRHMLIFGTSGMGKTYAIQALLCELGQSCQNSLIIDYTNGFHDTQLESTTKSILKPVQHIVRLAPVPINPFRQQCDLFDDMRLPEDPSNTAQRISGVFSEVYSFGDQQKSALYSAIKKGIENLGDRVTLNHLIEELKIVAEDNPAATSVISKIQPFIDMKPFGTEDPESWEKLFNDDQSRGHILQLAGFSKDAAQLITEFSLIDLYWFYRGRGNQALPRVIILDEIQNLDHRLESPLGKFLTEGRKFGISLILATQTLSNLDKDEKDRLFQASHKLFFRPADTELRSYAQILENAVAEKSDTWVTRLAALKKGECYSLGPSMNSHGQLESKAFKIRIASLEERFNN